MPLAGIEGKGEHFTSSLPLQSCYLKQLYEQVGGNYPKHISIVLR